MSDEAKTETLTDEMITALQREADQAGDTAQVEMCRAALGMETNLAYGKGAARRECAAAITSARAMDDLTPFIRVVAD